MAGKKRVRKPARTARTPTGVQSALEPHEAALFDRAAEIIESARRAVVRTTRSTIVHAYWLIGRAIVEVEQRGAERATYGDELLERLAERLSTRFGRGFSARTLRRCASPVWYTRSGQRFLPTRARPPPRFGQHC